MIKKTIKALCLSLGMAGLFIPALTQDINAQNAAQTLGVDPKLKIGKLPNGLTYYIRPNSKPENKVELRLIINAGSILETEKQVGLAHFTEHMLFNGTKNFPKNELVSKLQSLGVKFGADLNAYTSFDETVYMLPIPTDKPGNLETGFQILEDWAQGALLTTEDIDEERTIILEELRAGKGASDRMQKKFLPMMLNKSRYANRLPIGTEENLKTFHPKELRNYYKDWYRPDLMAVVVVGDITTDQAEEMIKKHFSGLTNPKKAKKRDIYTIQPYTKQEFMYLTDPEQSNSVMLMIGSQRPASKDLTVGHYRQTLIRNLVNSAMNERYQDLTESGTPPFIYAGFEFGKGFVRGFEGLQLVFVPSDDFATGVNALMAEVLSVEKYGFNAGEIERTKKEMLSGMEKMYNERNTSNSAAFVDELQRNFLEGETIPGIEKEFELYKSLLPTITLEEVNTAFKDMFRKEDKDAFFAVVMAPEKTTDKVNNEETFKAALNNALSQTPQAKEEKTVADNLLDETPLKGSIVSSNKNEQLGTTTYTLSNGALVTVKNTDFKADEIIFSGVKYGGKNNYGAEDKATVEQAIEVISAMGYGSFTPTELSKALTGKNVSVTTALGDITNEVSGKSDVKGLEDLLQLNYLKLTQPKLDKELAQGYISKMKNQLKFIKANPQAAFIDTLIKSMYSNNPLAPSPFPSEEDMDKINIDKALEIYKNEFSYADGYHFFLVGNIDENALLPLLETYVASLPSKGTQPAFKDNGLRLKSGNNKMVIEKGKEEKSLIISQYFGEKEYTEKNALMVKLIGDILQIRVLEKVREEMGAMYSGGAYGTFEEKPFPQYSISFQLPTGPENVDNILKAVDGEIASFKKDGPSETDLEKARNAVVEQRKVQIKTNNYWSAKLRQLLFDGSSTDWFLGFEKEINAISTADLKKAANVYFDGKNSFIGVLNPEKK